MTSRGRLPRVLGLVVAVAGVTACSDESSMPRAARTPLAETAESMSPEAFADESRISSSTSTSKVAACT